ncbi:MAG: hypothetical protein WBG30_08735 [Psychrilyobacter sp.]|uniref:hypothetical protein n=1 Tax=Psychrilyobacter sp. TaxID=2586924 RepID=UPI003C73D9F3
MAKASGNNYNNGNRGTIWINGIPILNCYKASIEKKINYENIPHPTIPGAEIRVPVGRTIEVGFAFKKTLATKVIDFESDDITMIMTDVNNNNTSVSTTEASGVTFDSTVIDAFEKGKVGEIEMSGQAEDMRKLI